MRQEIHNIQSVPFIMRVESKPDRVWTIYDDSLQLPIVPKHFGGAFLEDYVHDWDYSKGVFRFASRVATTKDRILLEWKD